MGELPGLQPLSLAKFPPFPFSFFPFQLFSNWNWNPKTSVSWKTVRNEKPVCGRGTVLNAFWLPGVPATLTAAALAARETNRLPFGARRSRKLARLRAENLPLQRFESTVPHLPPSARPSRPGPALQPAARSGLHAELRCPEQTRWGDSEQRSEAGRSRAKECSSILAREIIKKFMFTVTIHMTDSGQWKTRTTHKVVLQSCKFS
ncbi:uncharacterized protein LOC114813829 [Ornithorhynchus anatinus]|uniref:uncharacterized protein LOC114813829 n=1 Tax=Ornithorhynchus anatinus TaxID=9258 RepID=UPI0010A92B65|nr:uncharacterized protein LOC114813829 [Ornithorhynchus anatinus]